MVFCLAKPLEGKTNALKNRSNEMNLRSILGSHSINEDCCCYNYRATHWLDMEISQTRFLEIPSLDIEMPVYLGATSQHMADRAAVMSQTSIPIGGENTNCIIAGHRGWNGAHYFLYRPNHRDKSLGDPHLPGFPDPGHHAQ